MANKEAKCAKAFVQPVAWIGDVPEYLKHLSTCHAFGHIIAQGPQNLLVIQARDKVQQDDSIWTTTDVNACHKSSANGDLYLTLLRNGRLVSSTMTQNTNPNYGPRRLLPNEGIMWDCKPNVRVRDTFDTSTVLVLPPQGNSFFNINHLSEQ